MPKIKPNKLREKEMSHNFKCFFITTFFLHITKGIEIVQQKLAEVESGISTGLSLSYGC
jgi:hypothetical protein